MKVNIYNDDVNLIGTGEKIRGNLFYLDLTIKTCLFSRIEYVWSLNKRPCHVSFQNMVEVRRKKKVGGLPNLHKPKNAMCKQ